MFPKIPATCRIPDLLRVRIKEVYKINLKVTSHVAGSSFPASSGGLVHGDISS